MTRVRLALLSAVALALMPAVAMLALTPAGAAAAHPPPPPGAFVSLVPACACGRHTGLDLFSLTSGRRIRGVTALGRIDGDARLAPASDGGRLLLTVTKGARCDEPRHEIYMECPRWVPNSCRNTVEALSPGQARFSTAFTVAGSQEISEVTPDPAGNEVALTMTACVSIHGGTGLFVRGLRSGQTRPIATSRNRCDGYGPTAWNQAGTELAFLLSRADGKPIETAGGIGCPQGRDYLALASARPGPHLRLKLVAPDRGCIFRAVAFDADGIVATEGCNRDSPANERGNHLGQAVLVQYSLDGRVLTRRQLKPGLADSEIASVPHTGEVLITQDQAANSGYPPHDWVWQFDGHRLRAIAHYKAGDADQILAIPW